MRGAASAKGIESLTSALRLDPVDTVRAAAAGALGEFGSKVGPQAVTYITRAKDDPSAIVREAASRALEKLRLPKDS